MEIKKIKNYLINNTLFLILGIINGLSFINENYISFHIIAIYIFLYFFQNKKTYFSSIFLFSFGTYLTSLNWSFGLFENTPELYLKKYHIYLFYFIQSIIFAILISLVKLNKEKKFNSYFISIAWFFYEYIRSNIFGGNSWFNIGSLYIDSILYELYSVIGEMGITLIIIYLISLITSKENKINEFLIAILIIIFISMLSNKINNTEVYNDEISLAIIQTNINDNEKWGEDVIGKTVKKYNEISKSLNENIIVLPETAFPLAYEIIKEYVDEIDNRLKKTNQTMITGILKGATPYNGPEDEFPTLVYSAVTTIGKNNNIFYKEKLIPFIEENKTFNWLYNILGFKGVTTDGIISYEKKQENMNLIINENKYTASGSICYEIIYHDLISKRLSNSNFMFLLSNMSSFGNDIGQNQQFNIARVRALENKKPIVVSSNSGKTGLIDYNGKIINEIDGWKFNILKTKIQPRNGKTIFNILGYSTVFFLIFLFTLYYIFLKIKLWKN